MREVGVRIAVPMLAFLVAASCQSHPDACPWGRPASIEVEVAPTLQRLEEEIDRDGRASHQANRCHDRARGADAAAGPSLSCRKPSPLEVAEPLPPLQPR